MDWSSDVCSSDLHSLHHGPGKRKPVIGRRAAPDFIQNDEAPLGCLTENRGGFDHFDHEGGASPRQIVRRTHTAEQTIDEAEPRGGGGYETSRLRQNDDQRVLAQESGFAAHIGAGQIGRASCRERVCQYVYISLVAVSLKKKKTTNT